jgi:chorismate mutase
MPVRGIRGAITINEDRPEDIREATQSLLNCVQEANPDLMAEDIASVWFTVTPDIRSDYPARSARELGWTQVPLLCTQEIPVPNGLPKCIRILIHWNTELSSSSVTHVYLRGAEVLRPDLKK